MEKLTVLLMIVLVMTSCGSQNEELKEKVEIENQIAIDKQNENLRSKVSQIQKDINKMRAFINAIEGTYLGEFSTEIYTFKTRLVMSSTLPNYDSSHVKTFSELEFELQNLKLNIKSVSWNLDSGYTGGCAYANVTPDIENGVIRVFSEKCAVDYFIYITDQYEEESFLELSKKLARDIKEGRVRNIGLLKLKRSTIHNPELQNYFLTKKD